MLHTVLNLSRRAVLVNRKTTVSYRQLMNTELGPSTLKNSSVRKAGLHEIQEIIVFKKGNPH
jgi:hypothetical protein